MRNGGYTILNLSGLAFVSGTEQSIGALHIRNTEKPILISGLNLDGTGYRDFFATPISSSIFAAIVGGTTQSGNITGYKILAISVSTTGGVTITTNDPTSYTTNNGTSLSATATAPLDLNTITTPGRYQAGATTSANVTNQPIAAGTPFELTVETAGLSSRVIQIYYSAPAASGVPTRYERYYNGTTWGGWVSFDTSAVV